MIEGFDQAELYQYEQARKLSVALLEDRLASYKFKDWTTTETRGLPGTPEMRRERAVAIGEELNETERWHSHGTGISMAVLRKDLNLQVDDLDDDPQRRGQVKQYDGLLSDYLAKRGAQGVVHTVGRYLPLV